MKNYGRIRGGSTVASVLEKSPVHPSEFPNVAMWLDHSESAALAAEPGALS